MTGVWQFEEQAVRKMRVRGAEADPLAVRSRLSSLFGSLDLRPRGLPASSILCVRSLRDPLPGKMPVGDYRIRPPESWRNAALLALSELARNAARPYDGMVPA